MRNMVHGACCIIRARLLQQFEDGPMTSARGSRKEEEQSMGLFGKKPNKNVPVLSAEEVKNRILALNRETAPYRIMDGSSENVDLIAEWKIVDARWYEIFAKANLTKVFRIYMKLDPA